MSEISGAAVSRLVSYLRVLTQLKTLKIEETSSRRLAEAAQVSPFQVRKDLSRFGTFGRKGAGYEVQRLEEQLRVILGLNRPWHVAIVGMGRLGQAIAHYPAFNSFDFIVRAYFDKDHGKVGTEIAGIPVSHNDDLDRLAREHSLDIAFLTVPPESAQDAADRVVAAGIRGILNFAPTVINVPRDVRVEPVDFLAGLKKLSFYIQERVVKEDS